MSTSFSYLTDHGIQGLNIGAPDDGILKACFDIMSVSTKALYESGEVSCLQYGPNLGDNKALQELAKFLTYELKDEVKIENLMFNAGATQGLMLLLSTFFTKGDVAIVEDPSYFIALRAFQESSGLKVFPVASCDDGVDVDQLDEVLTQNIDKEKMAAENRQYWALVYLVPIFNNPRATCLSEEKSKKLIQVLRKHNVLALCDDVYNLCYFMDSKPPFTTPSPKRLFAYDKESDPGYKGNVVSIGSFSKFMGPGLRLGWIEAPKHIISIFDKSPFVESGGSFNHYTSCVIREALKLGLISKHLIMFREVLHLRMNALCDAIDKHLPTAKYIRPKGGYFVWVTFPESVDAEEVSKVCLAKYKVKAPGGKHFSCVGNFKNCLRLACSYYPEEILADCIEKLAMAMKEVTKQ